MGAYGTDSVSSGIQTTVSGKPTTTIGAQLLEKLGVPTEYSELAYSVTMAGGSGILALKSAKTGEELLVNIAPNGKVIGTPKPPKTIEPEPGNGGDKIVETPEPGSNRGSGHQHKSTDEYDYQGYGNNEGDVPPKTKGGEDRKDIKTSENGSNNKGGKAHTGTVYDFIEPTEPVMSGTSVPKSFNLTVNGKVIWVNQNATKHMKEYLTRTHFTSSDNINSQSMLTSLHQAIIQATSDGIKFNKMLHSGHWELIFSQRSGDPYPVLKHALYK
ncbi:hypothetical protein R84981_001269 [Carnimonas sp. R-84981]|uniref:hypothetical protein n=1 Tax=Carnimonas bestiolae TaxID=3402172 RepID=UPI003EDBD440